jgi:hypothetical protein
LTNRERRHLSAISPRVLAALAWRTVGVPDAPRREIATVSRRLRGLIAPTRTGPPTTRRKQRVAVAETLVIDGAPSSPSRGGGWLRSTRAPTRFGDFYLRELATVFGVLIVTSASRSQPDAAHLRGRVAPRLQPDHAEGLSPTC